MPEESINNKAVKSLTLFGKLLALSNKHSVRLLQKRGEESTETTEVNELTFCSVDDSKNESVKLIDQPQLSQNHFSLEELGSI